MGACSQIFNFAFWGIYAATDIAEAEQGRVAKGEPMAKLHILPNEGRGTEDYSRTSEEKRADYSARYDDQVPLCQRGI